MVEDIAQSLRVTTTSPIILTRTKRSVAIDVMIKMMTYV